MSRLSSSNMNKNARGMFHYNTEGMIVPPNVRKVVVDTASVKRLPRGAFSEQTRMYQLDFVSSKDHVLHEIGARALYKCRILAAFHPPPTVSVIGANALYGCASLLNVTLPNQLKILQQKTFAFCKLLESIRIPGSVQVIGTEAFMGCSALSNVVLEEGCLRVIEDRAFAECGFLASVTTPSTLEVIGNQVFQDCRCLRQANLAPPQARLRSIGNQAFGWLNRLETVHLPVSLESIGTEAFAGCGVLHSVIVNDDSQDITTTTDGDSLRHRVAQMSLGVDELSASAKQVIDRRGPRIRYNFVDEPTHHISSVGLGQLKACTRLVSIGDKCFQGCSSLGLVSTPPTMEVLPKSMLEKADHIVHLDLPKGLKIIEAKAFEFCYLLRAIHIPSTVTVIEKRAFVLCASLVSIEIPNGLESLGSEAFEACVSLVNIWLPERLATSLLSQPRNPPIHIFTECTQLISRYGESQDSIIRGLMARFQKYKIHELCCRNDDESTLENLQALIRESPKDDHSQLLVDDHGMTPCHILASLATIRMDLFQALMDAYPVIPLLCKMDRAGNYVLDYLYTNTYKYAAELEQLVLDKTLNCRIQQLGKESWRNQVQQACPNVRRTPRAPKAFHEALQNAYRILEQNEQKETAALLELRVWKQAIMSDDNNTTQLGSTGYREHARVKSGADAVLDSVMPFLQLDASSDEVEE